MKPIYLKGLFFSILFLSATSGIHAQFKVDAQFRTRLEFRDGYQKLALPGSVPTVFISQRTRLTFSYQTDKLRLKFTPQDVRLWGDEGIATATGVFGDTSSLDLFEGYTEIKLGNLGWISVGRQQLQYDSHRLFGSRNWSQFGLSYDAVVLKLNLFNWNVHLGGSWNTLIESSIDDFYPSSRLKSLEFIWLNREFNDCFNFSIIHIASGVTETDTTNNLHFKETTGIYSDYQKDDLRIWGNIYYQYGKTNANKKVNAFLFDLEGSYQISKFTPLLGISYLSGNHLVGEGQEKEKLFDVLYGNRHTYFGFMDYFRNFPSHTKQGGLVDYHFYLDFKFSKSFSIREKGHYFQLAQTNELTPSNKNLGFENELILTYKFAEWGVIESMYAFILPTETLNTIQNLPVERFSEFFYLQLTLTPVLFNQQPK